jgi:hypothetical protein
MSFVKTTAVILINLIFINLSLASNYKLAKKEIKEENKKKNYSISVSYHLMEGHREKTIQDNFNKYIKEIVNERVEDFKNDMQDWQQVKDFESSFEIDDTILLQNENVISIRLDGYEYYSGAAHPLTFFVSVNYDLNKNAAIKLKDLFTGDYLRIISDLCIQDLVKQRNEYAADDTDVSWIREGAGPKDDNYKVFNMTDSSLIVTFPVYQVASYAEGPREVTIPYSKIMKIIDKNGPLGYLIR